MTTARYTQHPLSAAFPSMTGEEFDALRADLAANGQRDPVTLHDGMVIDGWHRYSHFVLAGQEDACRIEHLPAGADPVAFVKSRNLHRRHLTASQRAMAVAACATWASAGGQRKSAAAAPSSDDSAAAAPLERGSAAAAPPQTLEQLAEDAQVSRRTMASAAKVVKQGTPEVQEAVASGRMTVEQGAEVAKLPPEQQTEAVKTPKPEKPKAPKAPRVERQAGADFDADAVIAGLRGQLAEHAQTIDELQSHVKALIDDNEAMAKVFEADDKAAEATKEAAKVRAEVVGLRERINGLMNEKNEAIRLMKHWRTRAEKAEKALAAATAQA